MNEITKQLLHWYELEKRPLPWRQTTDSYKIWISEIFLQQTQVSRVMDYYWRMIERFPTVESLAAASWEEFLPYFQGLGFYSRGRNMLKAAEYVVEHWDGVFPDNKKQLMELPGVGDYTASAICSFAYKQNIPALDTNLYRVMGRFFGIPKKHEKKLSAKDQKEIAAQSAYFYSSGKGDVLNHAFMDLGSSVCTSKKAECQKCPLQKKCDFFLSKKEIIPPKKKQKKVTAYEFSVLVLHHQKQYFFLLKESGWGFPLFFNAEKTDHRHFLKDRALEKWGVGISVRPPFTEIILDGEKEKKAFPELEKGIPLRFRFSRCQILTGEMPSEGFFSLDELKEKKNFEALLSHELLNQVLAMRF